MIFLVLFVVGVWFYCLKDYIMFFFKIMIVECFEYDVFSFLILVLVDFYVVWCGFCKVLMFVFEDVVCEFQGEIVFVKVDIDQEFKFVEVYGVCSILMFILIKDRELVECFIG